MIVGVPKEVKSHEYRVGLVPESVQELIKHGHDVLIETNAGRDIGLLDEHYVEYGAEIVDTAEEIYARADMIVKVKEPQESEIKMIREGQIIFTFLHLAADPKLARSLMETGCIGIAYETVTDNQGRLPLLTPMSEVAGRLAVQAGAQCLEKAKGGAGILLGGVPGVKPAKVVIIGGGNVGTNAIRMAVGLGARSFVLDTSLNRLRELDYDFRGAIYTVRSTKTSLIDHVVEADLVIGAVLVPGAAAPKLVARDMISQMRPGSVIVDVAIDQGGCFETSKPTTHDNPTFIIDDVVHYCVANMPGVVPKTSTFALNNVTLPYVLALADKGYKNALSDDPNLLNGLNTYQGKITYKAIADDLSLDYLEPKGAIAA